MIYIEIGEILDKRPTTRSIESWPISTCLLYRFIVNVRAIYWICSPTWMSTRVKTCSLTNSGQMLKQSYNLCGTSSLLALTTRILFTDILANFSHWKMKRDETLGISRHNVCLYCDPNAQECQSNAGINGRIQNPPFFYYEWRAAYEGIHKGDETHCRNVGHFSRRKKCLVGLSATNHKYSQISSSSFARWFQHYSLPAPHFWISWCNQLKR